MSGYRAGLVAVIGRPNVGKSTLINHLVGHKVSIVSDKVQTTRRRTLGILTTSDYQIAFVDTPGVHRPHDPLGKALNETAKTALSGVDQLLIVVDVSVPPKETDRRIQGMLQEVGALENSKVKRVLCMNKMDLLQAHKVERHFNAYNELFPNDANVMTSFSRGDNTEVLLQAIIDNLPEAQPLYDPEIYTDQPLRLLAGEIIREKALLYTRDEVPHSLDAFVEVWEEEEKLTRIEATILVERPGQKAIIIGKKGAMLKKIGTAAREEIEELVGRKVFLNIFVKQRDDWRSNPSQLRNMGYV